MKDPLLFPARFRWPGAFLMTVGLVLGALAVFGDFEISWLELRMPAIYGDAFLGSMVRNWFILFENNVTDELAAVLTLAGAMLLAFSRQPVEDEYVRQLRLESLLWATYVHYGLLILSILLVYGSGFFIVLILNVCSFLLVFIIRFYSLLWKARQISSHEE